ncbi:hypothetical protein G6O69_16680 [Pseudenhygromyxa sp. WMMC2535]|uniref:hypothetical protein n=1 Tax=Pseudenhygromyxa sp. WMMC2535 TaxID=2712867 RepID=UPI00155718F5|nr:hypothetical protein [Pseudenhygromyxa sp. WMMC2535]NVB39480.1 hypothetical protein [Pseudenhygromyxa sp. WMMC2535]
MTSAFREQYVLALPGGEDHILDLVPGRYELTAFQQDYLRREIQLSMSTVASSRNGSHGLSHGVGSSREISTPTVLGPPSTTMSS